MTQKPVNHQGTEKSLAERLTRRILENGPLPLPEFMAAALADPDFGYYMTRDPFGARGDFITAPEVSQIFGELIGLWCAAFWLQINSPPAVHLIELGPGRGTLMADVLRTAKSIPNFVKAVKVHLVEISPVLQNLQAQTLKDCGHDIHWHTAIGELPPGPAIVIANEFFDALPVNQYIKTDNGWCERQVSLTSEKQFEFSNSDEIIPIEVSGIAPRLHASPADSLVETCTAAKMIIEALTKHITAHGGGALIIDYGYLKPAIGETLQAVSKHNYTNVLYKPGDQDLTAHVNFSSLAETARQAGGTVFGPISQAQFLFGMGLEVRVNNLTKATTRAQACDIKAAAARLTDDAQMGQLFKVMSIAGENISPPVPFP